MENQRKAPDLESTSYDVDQAGRPDERMEAGKKDAVFFHVLGVVCTVAATIWMYASSARATRRRWPISLECPCGSPAQSSSIWRCL